MKRSPIFLLTFIGLALLTMGFHCSKDYVESKPEYTYTEKLTLTPYRKTYAIGDTIWVRFQTADKTLFDELSGKRVSTDTISLRVNFNFYRRYPIGNAVELFSDAWVENGLDVSFSPLYTHYNVLSFKTDCVNSNYFFRVGFVPKKPGVYSIDPHVDVWPCPGKLKYSLSTFKFTFDLPDCNKDVWLAIPNISRSGEVGFTDVRIDKKEIFVFKVE